jgi:hypothetical protein
LLALLLVLLALLFVLLPLLVYCAHRCISRAATGPVITAHAAGPRQMAKDFPLTSFPLATEMVRRNPASDI